MVSAVGRTPWRAWPWPDGLVLRAGDPVISFSARFLEPLRGFLLLMRAIPMVQRAHSRVRFLIVGRENGPGYGPGPPGGRHLESPDPQGAGGRAGSGSHSLLWSGTPCRPGADVPDHHSPRVSHLSLCAQLESARGDGHGSPGDRFENPSGRGGAGASGEMDCWWSWGIPRLWAAS